MTAPRTVYIDHMVSYRCTTAVRQIATDLGWQVTKLEAGQLTAIPPEEPSPLLGLAQHLDSAGFSLRECPGNVVTRIKRLIIAFVYDDLADSAATLSSIITENIGRSYPHLSRLFTRLEGRTIADFYRVHRMERARRLLVDTDEQVTHIAYRLHYGTGGRFTAAFREETGMSPTQFRTLGVHQPRPLHEL